jgi:hypothetical protein
LTGGARSAGLTKPNMKNKTLALGSICLVALACLPFATAEEKKAAASPVASASPIAKTDSSAAATPNFRPFHGMVSAVDHKAQTFTIAGKEKSRVFKVSDKTVVTKAGRSVPMAEIMEDVEVSGSYWKDAAGSFEAKTVKLGPMSEKKATVGRTEKASPSASPNASPTASPKKP